MVLVERSREIRLFDELFADTARGSGKIALVTGAVASGKTELLHAFADRCIARGGILLSATAAREDRGVPFGVLRQLLDWVPSAGRLVDELSAPQVSSETLREVGTLALRLSDEAPLLVAVDDVHHADEQSLDCLLRLVKRIRSTRVMLVLAESTQAWSVHPAFRIELVRQAQFRRIRLAPLTVDGVAEMLSQHLGQAAAWSLAQEAHQATGGNQLLVRALIEDYADVVEFPDYMSRPMGESFRQAVLACLYRSTPETLEVARGTAVLETTGSPAGVAELLDRDPEVVERALHALQAAGLVENGRFRHPLIRAAVYDDLDPALLKELHTQAARLLLDGAGCVTDIADHLVAAKQVSADWAVAELERAAERALDEDDEESAVRYIEFALSMSASPRQQASLRMLLIRAEWRTSPETAARHLEPLYQARREGLLSAEQTAALMRAAMWHGHVQDAGELIGDVTGARPEAGARADPFLVSTRNWVKFACPQFLPLDARDDAPAAGQVPSPPGQHAQAVAALSTVLGQGRDENGSCTRIAEQILQTSSLSDVSLEAVIASLQILIYAEQLPLAAQWCDALLAEADARGVVWWQAVLSCCRAEIAVRNGELVEAQKHALRALKLIGLRGWGVAAGLPLGVLVDVATSMGDFDTARRYLKEPVPDAMFQTVYGLPYLRARGRYYLATDRLQAALVNFRYCGELMTAWNLDAPPLIPWRSDMAEVYLRLGDHERAQQLAKEQMLRSGSRTSRTYGYSLRVLAATAGHRARLRILKESVEVLQARGDRLTLTQALSDLSRAHQMLGEFNKARVLSRRAGRLAKECRVQRMETETATVQEKPLMIAPRSREGWSPPTASLARAAEVLTLSERRVAALASLGYTNREISGKLHITVSTVEQHLTKVFRKLKVKRRTDLPVDLEFQGNGSAC
ncbi:helix-turn-helix transcriptional regulator [Streptomyces tsukubensis]|uniref:Helix-turn-helix transcriptional regulator n=1 Tax=Streptomyces tsukubensis (strain DSM 42081 / NBRC 108919 / NRRL 18488 / 9993) TaxID=1114943 RepID=A0A7G3UBW8_STRT9|nr:helix-turn-helix transcriptional regulator [Streptomyces tsukubensis]QKM67061.1 helix-turn-helix transcriptional regulator [Streptomyces tsukubensis NRRL18488]TAI41458.1 helix-turn-helix transcriptional regulator [Streptomyces tsukubensis]